MKKFWNWLFGPSEFDKHAERTMNFICTKPERYETQIKRYTMADGTTHFRAFMVEIFNGSPRTPYGDEKPLWATNSLKLPYMIGGNPFIGICLLKVAQFGTYEDARDAAFTLEVYLNKQLKRGTVVKIENV